MNNFAHLFKNRQNNNVDILWKLNLCQYDYNIDPSNKKYKQNRELIHHIKEPSF